MTQTKEKNKKSVCVDFDGVLSSYDTWRGEDVLGDPIPGAVAFTKELSKKYKVVIFTVRCGQDGGHHTGNLRRIVNVTKYLRKHGFAYDEIYCGIGKPHAIAYVDDRGVFCSPQEDSKAFDFALEQIKKMDESHDKTNYE